MGTSGKRGDGGGGRSGYLYSGCVVVFPFEVYRVKDLDATVYTLDSRPLHSDTTLCWGGGCGHNHFSWVCYERESWGDISITAVEIGMICTWQTFTVPHAADHSYSTACYGCYYTLSAGGECFCSWPS